tara:strand:- start:137 stop:382 length:246 start_codon:yes stop_codon:yes gene_type:complete
MQLEKMSLKELKDLRNQINNEIGLRAHETKQSLKPGMVVTVNHPRLEGIAGQIIKVNRTRSRINFGKKGIFNVPMHMIDLV